MNAFLHRTPLYEEHKALGARIIPFAGWEMPVQYAGVVQEHNAVRRSVGVFDVSHMGQLVLSGPSAGRVIDQLVTNDVGRLNVGDALYTVCCNTSGGILDDLIVYRLEAEKFLVVCNASRHGIIEPHVSAAARGECDFQDLFGSCALLAVQGPNAARLVERFDRSITSLKYFGVKETTMAGVAVTAARTGYTGEDGFELFCRADGAAGLFREILSAGKEFAIEPAGLGARDTLRLEAALPLYGNEIDETTHPFEAGLGWVVKLKKASFVGKDALVARRAAPPTRKLVGIEMIERGIARHGYAVFSGDRRVGVVTSGSPSPTLGKNVGLAYVDVALSEPGTRLGIEIRGKRIDAVVVNTPLYKRPS